MAERVTQLRDGEGKLCPAAVHRPFRWPLLSESLVLDLSTERESIDGDNKVARFNIRS